MIDMARVRADTPAAERIFLDSAGSSLPPRQVTDAVVGHLRREAEVGGYRAAAERADDLAAGRAALAALLDCAPEQLAFTDSATRSWLSLIDAVPLRAGDRVLTTQIEYGAHVVALRRLAGQYGFAVERIPSDETGQADVAALRAMLDERVKLVSVVHVPTNSGLISPVAELTAAAHECDALVLLDACQSVGQLPVRMRELGVDMLTGTGRKWLRGPRGTGFLASSGSERLWPRLVDHTGAEPDGDGVRLRTGAAAYELFEHGVAERLGLGIAARYALDLGIDDIGAAVLRRGARLRAGLDALPRVRTLDPGARRGGIVTFAVDGVPAAEVVEALWQRGVVVGGGAPAAAAVDMRARGIAEFVRASPHYFVTDEQCDAAVAAVGEL